MDNLFGIYYIRSGQVFCLESNKPPPTSPKNKIPKLKPGEQHVTYVPDATAIPPQHNHHDARFPVTSEDVYFVTAAWRNTASTIRVASLPSDHVGLLDQQHLTSQLGPMWIEMPLFKVCHIARWPPNFLTRTHAFLCKRQQAKIDAEMVARSTSSKPAHYEESSTSGDAVPPA